MLLRHSCLALVLVAAPALAGCGSESKPDSVEDQSDSSRIEATTPRGLAAAVMAHVAPGTVISVSGGGDGEELSTFVGTTGSDVTSVFVTVREPFRGAPSCGTDDGFKQVDCKEGRRFEEVVEKRSPGSRTPIYIGRAQADGRGHVLIEIFGRTSEEGLELVRALVADPLVGFETSSELNAEGETLDDFGELETEVEIGPVE